MNKIKNKIKVAMVGGYPSNGVYGGVMRHTYNLANHIALLNDIELHIITLGTKNEQFKKNNIHLHVIKKFDFRYFRPLDIIKLKRVIPKINPDIVHVQASSFPNSLIAAFNKHGYATLLTIHGLVKNEFKFEKGINYIMGRFVYAQLEKYAISKISNMIVDTYYDKESVSTINPTANIYIIPCGVESEYFKVMADEKPNHLLFVGLVSPRKGLIDLLKAMKIIVEKIPDVKLDIVGGIVSKEYFDMLNNYVKTNKLEENINFTGYLSEQELKRKYSEATLFVFPSYEESQGIVLLEAMACGKPVVASNIGGIPFVVENEKTGLLFECGDVEELSEKINVLLIDEELRKKMGEAGREKAKGYSWAKIAEQTVAVYKNIC